MGETNHRKKDHPYKRDDGLPQWHGWHAGRRGLATNLHRLGVDDKVIQQILRHANVNTTANYYIKTADQDMRTAMAKLEQQVAKFSGPEADTNRTPEPKAGVQTSTLQ